jgi:7-carboxy-7-deazaguanine synthase
MKLPIAEEFLSIQGEAYWTGTPMYFVRLAGCCVGKPLGPCHTIDNREFTCDTDFNRRYFETPAGLLLKAGNVKHLCITGGEPLMHDLTELIHACYVLNIHPHIETSGVKPVPCESFYPCVPWITVSPKVGALTSTIETADEIKLLVDEHFDPTTLPDVILKHPDVYIQPINDEKHLNQHNVKLCLELLKQHPEWHLSIQLHKILGLR